MNAVEVWFGNLTRKDLLDGGDKHKEEPAQAIMEFITVYNERAKPFKRRKREVKGGQLRNTTMNLRN